MSNLQTYYHFKLYFQKVDQHTGGKWLIHGTKRRKDNQLQSILCKERYHRYGYVKTDWHKSLNNVTKHLQRIYFCMCRENVSSANTYLTFVCESVISNVSLLMEYITRINCASF